MCHGPLLGKIVQFAIPLMMANLLTLMFHAADLIVLGQFADSKSMAAAGAAPSFTNLMLNLFWGVSAGINVLVSRFTGAKDPKNISKTVHTAAAIGCYGGIFMTILGLLVTKPVMVLMQVPDEIMDKACLYMWIWCLGIPFMIFYSFGSAILRSIGDTKRPMIFMVIAGIVNVVLNMIFVICFKWDVAGVAIATKLSNVLSAILVLRALAHTGGAYKIHWRKIRIHKAICKEMLMLGIPSGVQGMLFSISNVIIQSTINSFGANAIAGSTAALQIEGMVHTSFTALALAVVSFAGQNHGAKKYKRIARSIKICIGLAVGVSIFLICVCWIFIRPLLAIFNPDPEVIEWGLIRINYQFVFYFMLALMEVISGSLRGLGYSFGPTVVTLLGACAFRVFWVFAIFPHFKSMENLMLSYPVSWTLVCMVNGFMLYKICTRMLRNAKQRKFDDLTVK